MARVLVVYHSRTGNTRAMAQAVAEGVKEVAGVDVVLKEAEQVSVSDLIGADALAFGSPTYFSYMAGVLKGILDEAYLSRSQMRGKPFVAFASGGGGQIRSVVGVNYSCLLTTIIFAGSPPLGCDRSGCLAGAGLLCRYDSWGR